MTGKARRMLARSTKAASLAALSIGMMSGCSFDGVRRFFGHDTTKRPEVCLLVAPGGLPPAELDSAVAEVVSRVAAQHGTVSGFIANGPSAAAFPRITFDEAANGGLFASASGNQGARDRDAQRWGKAALRELRAEVEEAKLRNGLDLLGGLDQCSRDLDGARRSPTVVVVSTGLHRTVDLDLGAEEPDVEAFASAAADAVRAPTVLDLPMFARFDPAMTDGPPARWIADHVSAAWTRACDLLGDRCAAATRGG